MNRRHFIQISLTGAIIPFLGFPVSSHAQSQTAFRTLRNNVGLFTGRGGTIGWLATPETLVVVDAQFPETAKVCWEELHRRTNRPIDLLINTHHHRDHTAGNTALRPHATHIVAHKAVPALQRQAYADQFPQVYPDLTFEQAITWDAGPERITATFYGPAHTGGDAIIHFQEANIVHVGDLVFNRMPCFIDLPGGAATIGWIKALEKIYSTFDPDTLFIFGHGNPKYGVTGTRKDIHVMRDFLVGLREYVKKSIQKGRTLEEMTRVDRLPGFPEHYLESWKEGIPNAIRAVYQEISQS